MGDNAMLTALPPTITNGASNPLQAQTSLNAASEEIRTANFEQLEARSVENLSGTSETKDVKDVVSFTSSTQDAKGEKSSASDIGATQTQSGSAADSSERPSVNVTA